MMKGTQPYKAVGLRAWVFRKYEERGLSESLKVACIPVCLEAIPATVEAPIRKVLSKAQGR